MADEALARRYARAMVSLAKDANAVDQIEHELGQFDEVLNQAGGQLRIALENPGFTEAERRLVLDKVMARVPGHPYVRNLLRLLAEKNRFMAFHAIRRAYSELADEMAGRVRATVTTANAAGPLFRYHTERALSESTGKQVIVTYQTDPQLIGGVVARVGDTLFDGSVRARLAAMQETLVSGGPKL